MIVKFFVDAWDPSYGVGNDATPTDPESSASVVADVEYEPKDWRPIAAPGSARPPDTVFFIDGVRRTDAHVTVLTESAGDQPGDLGICASYAAGVVRCAPAAASLVSLEARRGLFTAASKAESIVTSAGTYAACLSAPDPDQSPAQLLSQSIQRQLGQLEVAVAVAARAGNPVDPELLIVDGPLRGRDHLPMTLGFIKSHRTHYLPADLNAVVGQLSSGDRTPVFRIGTSWERHTWYLRLPCRPGAPWTGVVRVECSAQLPTDEVVALANLSQATLPIYASEEHKDPRAPQNLYPIAGLENQLRRRLGDRELLTRALRTAAA